MFKRLLQPSLSTALTEKYIVDFRKPALGLQSLLTRSDEDLGGFSTVHLDMLRDNDQRPFARFHGDISLDLPEDRPDVVRLGYAMFRTKDLPPTMMGLGPAAYHDWSQFNQLLLRVRGDYRKYFINIQAETPYPTDLYQHRLFLKNPGQWETVAVSLSSFILTNGGVIQQQQPLDKAHINSVGIGLVDGQYGPYQLDIDWIKVRVGEPEAEYSDPSEDRSIVEATSMGPVSVPGPGREPQDDRQSTPGKRLSVDD